MAGERRINWGDDATDARYRTEDTGDGGNFVVAEDLDGATVLLEYDSAASEWVSRGPVNMSGNAITNVSDLDVSTVAIKSSGGFTKNALDPANTTEDVGDFVSVGGDSFQTIFDISGSQTILFGSINGSGLSIIRLTFGDGTTHDITSDAFSNGADGNGDAMTNIDLPMVRDVSKLEFKNDSGSSSTYGWRVIRR